jgi:hypothetical protein
MVRHHGCREREVDRRIDRLALMMATTMITGFVGLAGLIVAQS